MSTDVSQVGVTLFPSFLHFLSSHFPDFPFILIFTPKLEISLKEFPRNLQRIVNNVVEHIFSKGEY